MHLLEITGTNEVQINYDGTTVGFYINDCVHTILVNGPHQYGKNFFYINHQSNESYFDDFAEISGELDNKSLIKIQQFAKKLETGRYYISQLGGELEFVEIDDDTECFLYSSVETKQIVIITNSTKNLNRDVINKFKQKIIEGEAPFACVYSKHYEGAELEDIFFVVYGNEVLKAYRELFLSPKIVAMVNYSSYEYNPSDKKVLEIISSYKQIRNTSFKYFY